MHSLLTFAVLLRTKIPTELSYALVELHALSQKMLNISIDNITIHVYYYSRNRCCNLAYRNKASDLQDKNDPS